ncbi:MAG: phage/plasmid primase, P4 family [Bacillota bacterium]
MTEPGHRLSAPDGSGFAAFFRTIEPHTEYAGAITGGRGGKFRCPNPDHEDEHASLDVHVGTGNKAGLVVATCTPCREAMGQREYIELLWSMGVEFRGTPVAEGDIDWGPAAEQRGGSGGASGPTDYALKATYRYNHFDGSPNFKVRRLEDRNGNGRKTFSPQRWDDDKAAYVGGHGALDNVTRTPLNFEHFEDWAGKRVYLVEGEKACTAITDRGAPAFCFHGGTAGKRMEGWTGYVKVNMQPKIVIVWTDLDEAGLKWAIEVRDELKAEGVPAEIWCNNPEIEGAWVPKGDAFEQIASGGQPVKVDKALAAKIRALHPMPVKRTMVERSQRSQTVPENTENTSFSIEVEKADRPTVDVSTGYVGFNPSTHPQNAADWWLKHSGHRLVTQGAYVFYEYVGDHYRRLSEDELDKAQRQFWNGRLCSAPDPSKPPVEVKVKRGMIGELIAAISASALVKVAEPGVREVVASQMVDVPVLRHPIGFVPFRNGALDIIDGSLVPCDPSCFNTWRISADYVPGAWDRADSPQWVKFLESLGWTEDTDEYRLLRQIFGWILSGETRLHKIGLLIGPKRAGKGTILKLIQRLMGDGAVGFDLGQLDEDFGLQNLLGRTVAIDDDARFDTYSKRTVGRLLRISSFGISDVNVKNKPRLSTVLPVRMLAATNEAPKFNEASDALAGRFVVLKLTKTFYGAEDPFLDDKLAAEVAGIAKWAVEGYRDLVDNGLAFSETAAGEVVKQDIADMGNQVRLFVEESGLVIDTERNAAGYYRWRTEIATLYTAYESWAQMSGNRALSRQSFVHDFLTAYPECEKRKAAIAGKRGSSVWHILGVRL